MKRQYVFSFASILIGLVMIFSSVLSVGATAGGPDWDKSSLSANGACENGQQVVVVTNSGSGDMAGPVSYVVQALVKGGDNVGGGTIGPLASGESETLVFNFDFKIFVKIYQRPGHPGTGILWADVDACGEVTATPTDPATFTPEPTFTPTDEPTSTPEDPTLTPTATETEDPEVTPTFTETVVATLTSIFTPTATETEDPEVTPTGTQVVTPPATATKPGRSCAEVYQELASRNNPNIWTSDSQLPVWYANHCTWYKTPQAPVSGSDGSGGGFNPGLMMVIGLMFVAVGFGSLFLNGKKVNI